LVQRDSNDSREAFYKLLNKSKYMDPPLKELADESILNIIANLALSVGPHMVYHQGPASTKSDHIDIDVYKKNRNWMYRVGFLQGISVNYRPSKRDKFDFVAYVLEKDESLRAVEAARQILEEEAKINRDVRDVDQYIDWWQRNREKY